MKHRNVRGKIAYIFDPEGERRDFGREWWSVTFHEDQQRTLRAHCEIEPGVVADRSVLRETVYTTDPHYRPLDCFVRLHESGKFLGSGWFRFTEGGAECEAVNVLNGRTSQRMDLDSPPLSFGAHPVSCDVLHCARFDHSSQQNPQPCPGVLMSSREHDGCSGPHLCGIEFGLEYMGREEITVPAGTFETDHYRFLLDYHPTEDVWCTPDGFLFVKITVGGYMNAHFDLIEYDEEY